MCAALTNTQGPAASLETLMGAVSAIVSSFYAKSVYVVEHRDLIERGSEEIKGYLTAAKSDESIAIHQIAALAAKTEEISKGAFTSELEGLIAKLSVAAENLYLGKFCIDFRDYFSKSDEVLASFERDLKLADDLRENPFGIDKELIDRLKNNVTEIRLHVLSIKTESAAHKIIFSENQSEALEGAIEMLNKMVKEISIRPFLTEYFSEIDLSPLATSVVYKNLPVLRLQRLFVSAESMHGEEAKDIRTKIMLLVAQMNPVLRETIESKRPKEASTESISAIAAASEIEREDLLVRMEIESYREGLRLSLQELREYVPHRIKQEYEH